MDEIKYEIDDKFIQMLVSYLVNQPYGEVKILFDGLNYFARERQLKIEALKSKAPIKTDE
jgi:hypothetical protein